MAHIPMRSIRLKLDKKYCKKCNTVDSLTSQTPATWRANATEIEVGAFEDDIPLDLTGYTGLELVIRPDRTTSTNLAYKASATPDSVTITANGWTAGTDQHVTFSLTDSELNLDLEGKERQTYWLAVTASDASGNETTLGTSWFIVEEDNNATAAAPEENPGTGITEDIADARYIAKAEIDAKGDLITGSADNTPIILTAGADGQVLTASSAQPEGLLWTTVNGTGDMQAATYDPTPIGGDVFDMDNMVEGATTKILTDVERADIASNKAASHAAVTVSDSAEIDLTLTGQDISASIIAGSIDETKLDASTNISLGKANTSVQPNDDAAILGSGAAADGLVLKADGIGGAAWETDAGGGGGVTGPVTSTDNALARYDGTSGDFVQDSAVTVDDSGNITANNFTGTSSGANTGDQDLSTYQVKPSEGAFVNGDKTKLDGIAAGADVNDPTTLVDADIGVNVQAHSAVLDATTASFTTADQDRLDDAVLNKLATPSSTDNAIATWFGTSGKIVQNSTVTVDASGNIATSGTVDGRDLSVDGVKLDAITGTITDITDNVALSTGVLTGGVLSTGAGASQYSISDGTGIIVDETGAITEVSWTGKSNITPTNIATSLLTWVSIDSAGNVVEMTSPCTPASRRAEICLGVIVHVDKATVDNVNNEQVVAFNPHSSVYDLADALGFINVRGNVYSANGVNLNINKSIGDIFAAGSNYDSTPTNPHIKELAALTALTFQYRYSDGSNGVTGTAITPDVLDNGAGGTTAVTNNRWSIQRIYSFVSNNVKIQLGVEDFISKADAIAGIASEAYVTEQSIAANGLLRGWLVVKKGTTDLSDTAQAQFIEVGKLGEVGGATGAVGGGGGDVATDAIWDAAGDLAVGSGADTAAKLPIGTNGQVLTVTGGAVAWGAASAGDFLANGSVAMTGDIDCDGNNIDDSGVLFQREQAAADADVAAQGQWWTKTATPCLPYYTSDDGTDISVGRMWYSFYLGADDFVPSVTGTRAHWTAPAAGKIWQVAAGAQTNVAGANLQMDVEKGGTTIITGILEIAIAASVDDNGHSITVPTSFAAGDIFDFDIDQAATSGGVGVHIDLLISWD